MADTTNENKREVFGEKSSVGYNGNKGIDAPHINPVTGDISMDIGINGGHFQSGASQKVTLTNEPIDTSTTGAVDKNLITITRQDPMNPDFDKVLATISKNGEDLKLSIEEEALKKCLQDYETRTGKKMQLDVVDPTIIEEATRLGLTVGENIPITLYPKKVIMSDNNELQGVEIDAGNGTTFSISFDAAGMRITTKENELNEDGTPKLDEKGKQITHDEKAFLSAGTRPLNFTINPQFLYEASTVNPITDSAGNMIDPPIPSVDINGHIADNLIVLAILQEREKAQNADPTKTTQIISRTFGKNNEVRIDSVPVFEEGATEPYYMNFVLQKGKKPQIFVAAESDKGVKKAPKLYNIEESNIEAKSVTGATKVGEYGLVDNLGLHFGIIDPTNGKKIRLNMSNLTIDNTWANGIINYLDTIHATVGPDAYGGFEFNEPDKTLTVAGYYQKSSGVYLDKIPDPLPAGTTESDFKAIYKRSSTKANVIASRNTIANLQNNISDVLEEVEEEVKDFVYEPKIAYNTYTGKKLNFADNGTTSIDLPMVKEFGFEEKAAQKITLTNNKTIHAGENDTKPADPSEEKIISVTDPKLGGETISFIRNVKAGIPSYTMNFNEELFKQILEEYKTTNKKEFDLDQSLLVGKDGRLQFEVDKIIVSDDMKIQGAEIKAAGKTIAIDITAAGYMISNGTQVARHRMDKQPLDFTFSASVLNDEVNKNFTLQDGKIKDELQVMAIQQARFKFNKSGEVAKTQPVTLKYGENLTLYSIPIKVGNTINYQYIRQEKGKLPEIYQEYKSPDGAKKLAPKFMKMTNFNFEIDVDKNGSKKNAGIYMAVRDKDRDVPIRIGIGNVNIQGKNNEVNQGLISLFRDIESNSGGQFHFNNEPEAGSKIQGYYQFDTNPDGSKTCKFVNKPADEDNDPAHPSVAGRTYEPSYAIPGEREYNPVWDTVAQLQNKAQKEFIEKEPEEKKEKNWGMPKVPKRKKKKVNEYISTLGLIGVGCLSAILGIINPFFLILSSVLFATVVLKDSGVLAALVEAFGPRDRDALDVHNDIVNTRSKIVELDRECKDILAKLDEIEKRAGKSITPQTCRARYQNLIAKTNLVDANGKPIDINNVTVSIDPATGELILKDAAGNNVNLKNNQGFTPQQIEKIINNVQKLNTEKQEKTIEENNKTRLNGELTVLEGRLQSALRSNSPSSLIEALRNDITTKKSDIKLTQSNISKHESNIEELEELVENIYNKDFKDMEELKKRLEARKKALAKKRQKAKGLAQEGTVLYNEGTPYDLDLRNESTDEKGNWISGTEHYYNQNNRDEYDAANLANSEYQGNASNVQTRSDRSK